MFRSERAIFIHGLNGSSQGVKATLLRGYYPGMLIPDFPGSLVERMAQLESLIDERPGWTLIGSSFGGLMAALYACQYPGRIRKQVLLAPALIWPDFAQQPPAPVDVPTVIYHGTRDELIPVSTVRSLAKAVFLNLTFHEVDDDHGLYETAHAIKWKTVLE